MLKKHPEIIQETIKVKQKLVAQKLIASQTPTVTSEPGAMSIFHQNNLHSVMDAVPTSENNTEKSPQSPDPSNVPSNSHHTKEKSEHFEEAECDQAPLEMPDNIKNEETNEKTESPQPKGMYGKCSKKNHTFLFLFSIKILIFSAGSHKMFVRIANREYPDQTV